MRKSNRARIECQNTGLVLNFHKDLRYAQCDNTDVTELTENHMKDIEQDLPDTVWQIGKKRLLMDNELLVIR